MNNSSYENPFDLNKASDFTDEEIAEQWVDITNAAGGLVDILKPNSRMPMLLLGGKGSGKTHLMRYCSAPVQASRHSGDFARAAIADGYLGVYVPLDALNTDKFARDEPVETHWSIVFEHYFELWLATSLLATIRECARSQSLEFNESEFVAAVTQLFDIEPSLEPCDLNELLTHLTRTRKYIDGVVNNSRLRGERPDFEITFSTGRLAFGIPEIVSRFAPSLSDVLSYI
jgi:hypothetical protein